MSASEVGQQLGISPSKVEEIGEDFLRDCVVCGEPFYSKSRNKMVCTDECGDKARRIKKYEPGLPVDYQQAESLIRERIYLNRLMNEVRLSQDSLKAVTERLTWLSDETIARCSGIAIVETQRLDLKTRASIPRCKLVIPQFKSTNLQSKLQGFLTRSGFEEGKGGVFSVAGLSVEIKSE